MVRVLGTRFKGASIEVKSMYGISFKSLSSESRDGKRVLSFCTVNAPPTPSFYERDRESTVRAL